MGVELYRIDDRLIHGQVVVGWGQPLDVGFIVLVDDEVAASEWEQELYRMGVPPGVDVFFESVETAAHDHDRFRGDERAGIVLTGDIATMTRLVDRANGSIRAVNLGGIHHRAGRTQRLRYVFLTPDEERQLRELARRGVAVTAQDVPAARPVPLDDVLAGTGDS
ncbi:MAG TPA: PTS sugar transporter subunit IIB [Gemmatimonadaceae bacterium]|nr:PTS sugar transporter subunit IIB [Gemmatimonadaceae bacterium]